MNRIEDFNIGDSINVISLKKASKHFKTMCDNTSGIVICNLTPEEILDRTQNTLNEKGLLVKLKYHKYERSSNYGGMSLFKIDGEFIEMVLTNNDSFTK